jgi:predicted ribosomally synthesized peptide with nif11-like leader
MSLAHVKAFYQQLAKDEALRNQIQSVNSKEECSQIVKAAGYDFTLEEYEEYTAQLLESADGEGELKDLSEKELAAVFGGLTLKYKIQPMYGAVWLPDQPMYGIIRVDDLI